VQSKLTRMIRRFVVGTNVFIAGAILGYAQEAQPLRLIQAIPLPNVHGYIDHMDADVEGKRLFVPTVDNGSLEVVDLTNGRVIRSIPGFKTPAGASYVPELNKLFVTSKGDGMVRVFRGDTLDLIDSIKLELGPNRVMYDPVTKFLYVGYGGRDAGFEYGRIGVIDAQSHKLLGDMIFETNRPGEILLDRAARRILISESYADRIDVFDARDLQLLLTWSSRGRLPVDMGFDPIRHRLFVGTRQPPEMTVYDSDSGQEVVSLPTVETMDGVDYDARNKRVYVSGGLGLETGVYVYQQIDADHYELIGKVPIRGGAGTSHWVPGLNRYFVAAPTYEKQDAAILVFEPQP
jgi:DNA-binding beta-propeller fold protein YncE